MVFSFERQLDANNAYHKVSGGSYEYFEGMDMPKLIARSKSGHNVRFVLNRPEAPFWLTGHGLRIHSVRRIR